MCSSKAPGLLIALGSYDQSQRGQTTACVYKDDLTLESALSGGKHVKWCGLYADLV